MPWKIESIPEDGVRRAFLPVLETLEQDRFFQRLPLADFVRSDKADGEERGALCNAFWTDDGRVIESEAAAFKTLKQVLDSPAALVKGQCLVCRPVRRNN